MTKHIPGPREAFFARNKRAEGRSQFGLFLALALAGAVIVSILVIVMLSASTKTSRTVLAEQDKYTIYSNSVVQGLFSIVSVRYADDEQASCTMASTYQRAATMTLRFQTFQVPQSCELFLNNRFIRTERRLEPDCNGACTFQEFNRQFSLGELDYRDDHQIKVCCADICLAKTLPALCG